MALLSLLWRLPPGADLVVRRGPGTELLLPLAGRDQDTLRWTAAALLLLAAVFFFIRLAKFLDVRKNRSRLLHPGRVLGLLMGLAVLLSAARLSISVLLRLQDAWFGPAQLDLVSPSLVFFWVAGVLLALQAAVKALAGRLTGQSSWLHLAFWSAALLLPGLALEVWGTACFDLGRRGAAEAAGVASEPRSELTLFILGEKDKKPEVQRHDVPLGVSGRADMSSYSVDSLLSHGRRDGVFSMACLRLAAEGALMNLDEEALRAALFAAAGKDPLAWLLLAEHLASAPRDSEATDMLASLSDEAAYLIGPLGAARLAAAYAGLDAAKAAYWTRRASEGPGGLPEGLASVTETVLPKPSQVQGTVRGPAGVRVAIFRRRDELEAPILSPGGLAASAVPDPEGRFSFSGLPAGEYFLALSVPGKTASKVEGHRGMISLSAQRLSVTLPPLTLR